MRGVAGDRIRCSVIGCGRTASKDKTAPDTEIICGIHWRTVSRHLRRRYFRLRRLIRKAEAKKRDSVAAHLRRQGMLLWNQIKVEAIEAAVGIG